MLMTIILGIFRHLMTTAGGALAAYSVQFIGGLPQVHNMETLLLGGVMAAAGTALSVAQKVKTESGPIYKTNR